MVKSGAVKTVHIDHLGQEKVLGLYLPGDLFGLDGVYSGSHACSSLALERSLICRINFSELEQQMVRIPKLQHLLLRVMSEQLHAAHNLIRYLSQSTAEERVVRFILDLAERYRQRKLSASEFRLAMTKTDAANYLGLAVETFSRILSRLRARGLILIQGRKLQILDEPALRGILERTVH
ncbi:helix-turn-helix domain-containing protein [Marinobacter nauticus]